MKILQGYLACVAKVSCKFYSDTSVGRGTVLGIFHLILENLESKE